MRFKKIITVVIVVLTIFVIMCSSFSISANAISSNTLSDCFDFVILSDQSLSWYDYGTISGNTLTFNRTFLKGNSYNLRIELSPNVFTTDDKIYQKFSGNFDINNSFYFQTTDYTKQFFNAWRGVNGEEGEQGNFVVLDWWINFSFDYSRQYLPTYYSYYFDFVIYCTKDSRLSITFNDLDIQFLTPAEVSSADNTDKIIQNQDENTDKILNGDADLDSSGETGKVDGTIGGIDNATSDALGGKTDEQIQEEISGALDTDSIGLDFNKAQRISNFFDGTLEAFGVSYKTLLLLSLCLGLSAFLIGRRYS